MKGGDISNVATPRMWFVWEGFVGIPTKPLPKRQRAHLYDLTVRNCFTVNSFVVRRAWDLSYRYSLQLNVVTFLGHSEQTREGWRRAVQAYLDDHDAPLTVFAFDLEVFVHEIVPSPGVYRVFDSAVERTSYIGGKATLVDATSDFDPIT